jgi:predicted alpha/beta-hydrolase family hydrolase
MTLYPANPATDKSTLLVLAHGAGAGPTHPFMVRYARGLAERGLDVVTFSFPYMETGRKTPDRAPVLEEAFRRAVSEAAARPDMRPTRLLIGGKSMGGRIATHLAAAPEAWPADAPTLDGVIALGYPLSPGGSSRQDRVAHLFKIGVPTLIVQGTRDNFGGPADINAAIGDRQPLIALYPVPTGDHSFAILKSSGKTQAQIDQDIWDAIISWMPCPRTANAT